MWAYTLRCAVGLGIQPYLDAACLYKGEVTMTSTLKFRVVTEVVTDEIRSETPFMLVHVVPLIDGDPYIDEFKDYPFEAVSVYAMDLKDGEVWPFNCECGTPSCAGMNDPMQMWVTDSTVRWQLPDVPFSELAVNPDGTPKPREFIFDRGQYQAAFQSLFSELKDLEKTHGTLKIHPVFTRSSTLDGEIEIERSWAEYRRIRRSALGDLDNDDIDFVVTTQDGLELTTELSQFVYEVTREFLTAGIYDLVNARKALDRLGNDLRSDPAILLRQLDVHRLSASLRAAIPSFSDDGDDPKKWPAPYWTCPDSPKEDIDYWVHVQQTGSVSLRRRY